MGASLTGHIEELQGVMNSASKTIRQINGVIRKNKNLSKDEISVLKETKRQITELKARYQSILDSANNARSTFD